MGTTVLATVSAAPQYPVAHPVAVAHAPAYVAPDLAEVSPYSFNYAVADDYSGAAFNQAESNDGTGVVEGSYSVNLPDGRIQHVNYHANDYDGFVSEVSYDGTAAYPEAVAHGPVVAHAAPLIAHAPVVSQAVAHPAVVAHRPLAVAHPAVVAHRPVAVTHPAVVAHGPLAVAHHGVVAHSPLAVAHHGAVAHPVIG